MRAYLRVVFALTAVTAIFLYNYFEYSKKAEKSQQLSHRLTKLADNINNQIKGIETSVLNLASATVNAFENQDSFITRVDKTQYQISDKRLFRINATSSSAVFSSNIIPIDDEFLKTAYLTEAIETHLSQIELEFSVVGQVYYIHHNSFCRIFPPFDVISQNFIEEDFTCCHFYYLADEKHNPEKNAVWIDEPYVDGTGRGWLISCIAPVYRQNQHIGTVGADLTLELINKNWTLSSNRFPVLLVSDSGQIIGGHHEAFRIFSFPQLVNHNFLDTIKLNSFLPKHFNLKNSQVKEIREISTKILAKASFRTVMQTFDKKYLVGSQRLEKAGLILIMMTESP